MGSKLERPVRTGVGLPPLGQSKGALPVSRGRGYEGRSYERGPCGPRSTTSSISHPTPRGDVRSGSELGLLPKPGRYFKYSLGRRVWKGAGPQGFSSRRLSPGGLRSCLVNHLAKSCPRPLRYIPPENTVPWGLLSLAATLGAASFSHCQ